MKKALLAFLAVMMVAGASMASIISINVDEASGRAPMAATDVAGATSAIRVGNWNNYNAGNRSLPGDVTSPVADAFVYDDGTPVGGSFAVAVSGPGGSRVATTLTNDKRMYYGSHQLMQDGATLRWDITGIPFAEYDIYVYATGQSANLRGGSVQLVGGPIYYVAGGMVAEEDGSNYIAMTTTSIPASPTSADIAQGNYAVFGGLTGASQSIVATSHLWGDYARFQVYGLQIVQVPEPATAGLLALGGLALLRRRRA